jgi:PAS domain-containing protein
MELQQMDNTLKRSTKLAADNEESRMEVLKRYEILDTPPEEPFDNLVKLATKFFNLPISALSFIDTENAFVKAIAGGGPGVKRKVARTNTLCTLAMESPDVLVMEDLTNIDPCLFVDPVFIAELGFKFYAGAPLVTRDGFRIGTLCVIGSEKRTFTLHEAELLKGLARIAMDEIELRLKGLAEAENKIENLTRQIEDIQNNLEFFDKAPVAIGVLRGEELIIGSANERILEVWGRNNEVIGHSMKAVFPELEGQHFFELMDGVLSTGVPYYGNEECAVLMRNHVMENVYFNFVYQPLQNEAGQVDSIMIVATEITDQIMARQRIEVSEQKLSSQLVEQMATNEVLSQTVEDLATANSKIKKIHDTLQVNYNNLKYTVTELIKSEPRLGDLFR